MQKKYKTIFEKSLAICFATFYPANDKGAPDWQDIQGVERSVELVALMPPTQKKMLKLLFIFLELFAPTLLLSGFGRFSSFSIEKREKMLLKWMHSNIYYVRLLYDGIKAFVAMVYYSHPKPLEYVKYYKSCRNPKDPFQMKIKFNEPAKMKRDMKLVRANKKAVKI